MFADTTVYVKDDNYKFALSHSLHFHLNYDRRMIAKLYVK